MDNKQYKIQRVAYKDAEVMLEKIIKNYKGDPLYNAIEFVEDYAGGSQEFINRSVVNELIKKLTR